jgi:hypothetical protein
VYTDIALETVTLDTPNNVQFLSHMLQLNVHQCSVLFQNWAGLPFSDSFTKTLCITDTNALTLALQSVNKQKTIQCCQLKFFQCRQHKQILFLSFLVFPLCCSPPVCLKNKTNWIFKRQDLTAKTYEWKRTNQNTKNMN